MEDYDYSGYEEGDGEDFDSSMMEGAAGQTKGRSLPLAQAKKI
jgi:hypothetical protein